MSAVTDAMVEAALTAKAGPDVIQGFYYDSSDLHVIRDVTKPYPEQELWRVISPDYDAAHAAMMLEIERIKVRRVIEAALASLPESGEAVAWKTQRYANGMWVETNLHLDEPTASSDLVVIPLYDRPSPVPDQGTQASLERALDFIESLTADPLLMGDDIEMTLDDVQAHARIELASIRKQIAAPVPDQGEVDRLRKALELVDFFWTSNHPAGPEGDRKHSFGQLSDGTIEVWRAIRAALEVKS